MPRIGRPPPRALEGLPPSSSVGPAVPLLGSAPAPMGPLPRGHRSDAPPAPGETWSGRVGGFMRRHGPSTAACLMGATGLTGCLASVAVPAEAAHAAQPGFRLTGETPVARGAQLVSASRHLEAGASVFAGWSAPLSQKVSAYQELLDAYQGALPGGEEADAYAGEDQARQVRAAAAPLLLDLAASLNPTLDGERALQNQIVGEYVELAKAEPHGLNRNFMIYDLHRVRGSLSEAHQAKSAELMREVAPLTPPYEAWFKDGNDTLRVDYHVGAGFWQEELAAYEAQGYARTNNGDGTVTLKRTMSAVRAGETVTTHVELRMHNGSSKMFERMNDPDVHVVVYSGHANYGREIPSHLDDGTPQAGEKLFLALQCGGKGVHDALLEAYPELHVVASKNSSYGSEDRDTFTNVVDGIAKRQPWSQIARHNAETNARNYYFPSDALITRRTLDLDGDGRVDSWDRVVSYDTFAPKAEVDRQLTPKDPGVAPGGLDGRAVHGAIQRFHRLASYNQWASPMKNQGVLNHGYYDGAASDPLMRLEHVTGEDGKKVYELRVNKHYAHASEETLSAVLHYELGRYFAEAGGLSDADAEAVGLLMATESLKVDTGNHDHAVWSALLDYAGLNEDVELSAVKAALSKDSSLYGAGSYASLNALKAHLAEHGLSLR